MPRFRKRPVEIEAACEAEKTCVGEILRNPVSFSILSPEPRPMDEIDLSSLTILVTSDAALAQDLATAQEGVSGLLADMVDADDQESQTAAALAYLQNAIDITKGPIMVMQPGFDLNLAPIISILNTLAANLIAG